MPAGRDGQVVLVAGRLCRASVRRLLGFLCEFEGFLPGVDPGAQFPRQKAGERAGGHLLRVQHTGLGHEAVGPDDQRLRRRGQHLATRLFEAFTTPGFALGPNNAAGAYYGRTAGVGQVNPPKLRIRYTK
ncbi:hypothetical protein ABZ545_22195 [Streptomyces abikoensis]|uniref:hypothetical protein n=1 Tax=Streptomyces abikoensis TaxID=97398 RepID=UPI0033E33510